MATVPPAFQRVAHHQEVVRTKMLKKAFIGQLLSPAMNQQEQSRTVVQRIPVPLLKSRPKVKGQILGLKIPKAPARSQLQS